MIKRIAGLSFVVAMLALTAAAFAADHKFVTVNKTGVEIHHMYVSPSEKDEWGDDILGEDVCPPNANVTITLTGAEASDLWDLRIEDSEENAITWTGLKLGAVKELTLHYENGKAWADGK